MNDLSPSKLIKNFPFWKLLDCHKVSRINLQHTLIDPQKLESSDFIFDTKSPKVVN